MPLHDGVFIFANTSSNLLAMTYLQQEDFSMVLELLKKAEILTERDPAGKAATYNNLACYYRRLGKLHAALTYLQKALKIESKLSHVQNPADTHINACAVLSQLGKHASALEHAQTALILLQEELLVAPGTLPQQAPSADRIAVLAIAYHNIGVEQEFLKRYGHSILSYRKGVEVAERYLGAKHPICNTLKTSMIAAKKTLAALNDKANKGKTVKLPAIHSKTLKTSSSNISGKLKSKTKPKTDSVDQEEEKLQSLKEEVLAESFGGLPLDDSGIWNQNSSTILPFDPPAPETATDERPQLQARSLRIVRIELVDVVPEHALIEPAEVIVKLSYGIWEGTTTSVPGDDLNTSWTYYDNPSEMSTEVSENQLQTEELRVDVIDRNSTVNSGIIGTGYVLLESYLSDDLDTEVDVEVPLVNTKKGSTIGSAIVTLMLVSSDETPEGEGKGEENESD